MKTRYFTMLVLPVLWLAGGAASRDAHAGSVRAHGMAGAYTALADGIEAASWNPANLARTDNPGWSVDILSASASLTNNGFDLDLYNRTTGATLSHEHKLEVLSSIPSGGLDTGLDARMSALGFQKGRMAFSLGGIAVANGKLPADLFELVLMGNSTVDDLQLGDADAEGYSLASTGLSLATTLHRDERLAVHLGGSARYLQGLAYARVTDVEGHLTTTPDAVVGSGHVELLTATGGSGFGLDLGVAVDLDESWRAGLSVQNALAWVLFDDNVESRFYEVSLDSLSVVTLEDNGDADDLFEDRSEVTSSAPVMVFLPPVVSLGAAWQVERTHVAFEWTQGFSNRSGSETSPRLALGAEHRVLSWLPVRTGFAFGGVRGPTASAGAGLRLGHFRFDVAAAVHQSLWPGNPKGISLGTGLGLSF